MRGPVTILCANLKGNIGDYAILEAMGHSFERRYPGIDLRYFHHANKPADPVRYPVFLDELSVAMKDMGPAPFHARPTWFRLLSKLFKSRSLTRRLHNRLIGRVTARLCRDASFADALRHSACVVFAGGSQWGKANLNLNMFAQLTCASRVNARVTAFPFGISEAAFEANGRRALAEMLAQLSPPIPVRDVISYRLLNEAGLDAEHVSDCVFTMSDLFQGSARKTDDRDTRVFVSLTDSGQTTAAAIIALFDRLRHAGFKPVLFSSCEVEDRPLADAVLAIRNETFVAPRSWKEAVGLFSDTAFVLTNRLHCLIFAALAGTAVIPLANRQKARAYAEDAQLSFAPSEISEITADAIEAYAGTLEEVRIKQRHFLEVSATKTEAVIDRICALA